MDSFQIFLREPQYGTSTLNNITNETLVSELKLHINEKRGIPIENIRMIFAGKDLKDNETMAQNKIIKESTITVINRFPSQAIVNHPKDFFGDSLNDFIFEMLSEDDFFNKSVIIIGGCKIGSERKQLETYLDQKSLYISGHDLFKQQLPLPLLIDNYKNNRDIHLFLIDPMFKNSDYGRNEADIYPILQNTSYSYDFTYGKVYLANIMDIFREIKLKNIEELELLELTEGKEVLINIYILPYSYSETEKQSIYRHLNNIEKTIYFNNIPHQNIDENNFKSNSTIKNEHILWHNNIIQLGGKLPKQYTSNLSKKDKQKQIKAIKKASKQYKKGIYISRPHLKSFKSKKSSWTKKFEKKYGKDIKSYKEISKATGIPVRALDSVVKKGMGAYYSSGSRPNQTPESWGKARMYSYILGGPARDVDKDITKKYNVKF